MRIVIQRVSEASVSVGGELISKIEKGMMILLGIEDADTEEDVDWLCNKLSKLRIFSDENDAMNLDINQIEGSFLVVSQFTLHAMTKKGNRPSFIRAARPEKGRISWLPSPPWKLSSSASTSLPWTRRPSATTRTAPSP